MVSKKDIIYVSRRTPPRNERFKIPLPRTLTDDDPLTSYNKRKETQEKHAVTQIQNELSPVVKAGFIDPLTAFSMESSSYLVDPDAQTDERANKKTSLQDSWTEIMRPRFPNECKISLFSTLNEWAQKLDFNTTQSNYLSGEQFISLVEDVNLQLVHCWKNDDRAAAMSLIVQMTEILSHFDVSLIKGFRHVFYSFADTTSYFGQLIFNRIVSKCPSLRVDVRLQDVSDEAKELCINWMMKITSIRELVPRILIEIVFLRSYKLIFTQQEIFDTIDRIGASIRGVANPVVASYIRAFFVFHVCQEFGEMPARIRKTVSECTNSLMILFKAEAIQIPEMKSSLEFEEFLNIFYPPIQWHLHCFLESANEDAVIDILRSSESVVNGCIWTKVILDRSSAGFVQDNIATFVDHVRKVWKQSGELYSCMVIESFGLAALKCSYLSKSKAKLTLGPVWDIICQMEDPLSFARCSCPWIEFTARHFRARDIDRVLLDVKMKISDNTDPTLPKRVLNRVILHNPDIVLHLVNFVPLFDQMLEDDQLDLTKRIMNYLDKQGDLPHNKSVAGIIIGRLGRVLSKSIDILSSEDEVNHVSSTICSILNSIQFDRADHEGELRFLTELRGIFTNLSQVQEKIIWKVNNLAVEMEILRRNQKFPVHLGFFQACCAFLFITIPSLACAKTQLAITIEAVQTAFFVRCFSQALDFVDVIITRIAETAKNPLMSSDTSFVESQVCNLLGLLLAMPQPLCQEPLRQLLKTLNKLEAKVVRVRTLTEALKMLSTLRRIEQPYCLEGLDEAGLLWPRGDELDVSEIDSMAGEVLQKILNSINEVNDDSQLNHEVALLSWHLFMALIHHADLDRSQKVAYVALKAFKASQMGTSSFTMKTMAKRFLAENPPLDVEDSPNVCSLLRKIHQVM